MSMIPDERSWGSYFARIATAEKVAERELRRERERFDDIDLYIRRDDLMRLSAFELSKRASSAEVDASDIADLAEAEIVARRGRNVT